MSTESIRDRVCLHEAKAYSEEDHTSDVAIRDVGRDWANVTEEVSHSVIDVISVSTCRTEQRGCDVRSCSDCSYNFFCCDSHSATTCVIRSKEPRTGHLTAKTMTTNDRSRSNCETSSSKAVSSTCRSSSDHLTTVNNQSVRTTQWTVKTSSASSNRIRSIIGEYSYTAKTHSGISHVGVAINEWSYDDDSIDDRDVSLRCC